MIPSYHAKLSGQGKGTPANLSLLIEHWLLFRGAGDGVGGGGGGGQGTREYLGGGGGGSRGLLSIKVITKVA